MQIHTVMPSPREANSREGYDRNFRPQCFETDNNACFVLRPYSIDIWDIDLTSSCWDKQTQVLHDSEHVRFDRMPARIAACTQRRCRIALRCILSSYVGINPKELRFSYGSHGKPFLDCNGLHFNISHCGGVAICAVSTSVVGIDVEHVNLGLTNIENLLARICHSSERASIPAHAGEFFFRLWTRKEAYCKATGYGLLKYMDEFSLIKESDGIIRVNDPYEQAAYHIVDIPMREDLMAAVCSHYRVPTLTRRAALCR